MQDPKPGSREARAQGCKCPVYDNAHGKGRGGDGERNGWYMATDCPLHGAQLAQGPTQPIGDKS